MLARRHNASTDVGAAIAAFCVPTACIYTSEVVARYFFNAPLNWSGDVSSYLLCACTFLALPMVTRSNGHVAIGYFLERMQRRPARYSVFFGIVTGSFASRPQPTSSPSRALSFLHRGVLTTQATRSRNG